jgi:acetyltransferase-like isoleucine patch superfamily enzyme
MSISSLAQVSPGACIGSGATIGPFTIIGDHVEIGNNVTIESHCIIGHPSGLAPGSKLFIGDDSLIRSHSVFYEGSTFGPNLRTGHRVTVRELVRAGLDLQIGTLCDFQGLSQIGNHVRTHSNVHIGQGTTIGDFVWIFPYTVLTNDPHPPSDIDKIGPTIEDYAVIATMSCILPRVRIGTRSLVGAHSLVSRDVAPDTVVSGVPAKVIGPTSSVTLRDGSKRPAYPWMAHFRRGYPEEVCRRWDREYGSIELQGKGRSS